MDKKKPLLIFLLFFLTQYIGISSAQGAKQYFVISSGSPGGNYHKTGMVISESLNKISDDLSFINIQSTGSIENISKLKSRFADFAIVQQDVLLKSLHGEKDRIKNITLLLPLFQEKFIIYTHHSTPTSFETFKQATKNHEKLKIGVTSKIGTTYKTFLSISNLLGVDLSNIIFVVDDYSVLIKKFKNKDIDYFITFSLPIKELEKNNQASIVYFKEEQISLLKSKIRQLSESSFEDIDHKTIGVWTFLIGIDSSIKKIGEREIEHLLVNINKPNSFISKEIQKTLNQFKQNKNWHDEYLSEVPVSPYLLTLLGYQINHFQKYYFYFIAFFIIFVLFYFFNQAKLIRPLGSIYVRKRYKYILGEIIVIVFFYLLFVQGMIYYENKLFDNTHINSRILNMGFKDTHFWNLIRIFTTNEADIFPLSSAGKLMIAASAYVIVFGIIMLLLIEWVYYNLTVKRRKGLMDITDENHIIIAGWSDLTPNFIKTLLSAYESSSKDKTTIVCIAPSPEEIKKNNHYINDLNENKEILFVDGYVRQEKILKQSNAHLAKTIILLSDDNSIKSDEKTLLRALTISKFCKKNNSSVYVIAQVNNSEFVEDMKNAGVNGIVNQNIVDNVLIQSILNPGISKLMNNILSYSKDTNEFYTISLSEKENSHLLGKTFNELLLPLREKRILLIAIRVVYADKAGNEIIDEEKISELLKSNGLYRQIITNPITDKECELKTSERYQLLVLAVDFKKLKEGIKKIKEEKVFLNKINHG